MSFDVKLSHIRHTFNRQLINLGCPFLCLVTARGWG